MLRIFFLLSATLFLNHPFVTFAHPRQSPFGRISFTKIDNTTPTTPSSFWGKTQKEEKVPSTPWRDLGRSLVEGTVQQGPRIIHHLLYWLTAFDAIESVRFNEYRVPYSNEAKFVPSMYSKLFYFARLRPRLLYAVGALLRALQLCTPFQMILDPNAGVGAGVNFFAMVAGSRWPQPVVLGWATTKWLWVWLGARKVEGTQVPIKISIRELEKKDD